MRSIIDQCGELFLLGDLTFRCVLKIGHKGQHRATLHPLHRQKDIEDQLLPAEEAEEVTLP